MADIKIKKNSEETTLEIIGVEHADESLIKAIKSIIGKETQETIPEQETAPAVPYFPPIVSSVRNARMIETDFITPETLRDAIQDRRLDKILSPFCEIDIPIDTGGTATVVCAYVEEDWARFVPKDCWDQGAMNDENTNKTGYYKSKARKHVLEDILPKIVPEWRELMVPRKLCEVIDGEKVEYADLMWLPSATDVFGPSNGRWWNDEPDSFQMEIFKRERDRIKELGDEGTYPWWLRSVYASAANIFCGVNTDGSASNDYACYSIGFAPGFDI